MKTESNQEFLEHRKQLGQRIQELRKQKSLSQEELASRVGVDRVHVGYIEQGIRSASLEIIFAISKALDTEPKNLFEFTSE